MSQANRVVVKAEARPEGRTELSGTVKDKKQTLRPTATIDADERMTGATCTCYFYKQNKLLNGPCEHILALRMAHNGQNRWWKWRLN